MSFQPLIVVILLIFLLIIALAVFLWFLISPTAVVPEKAKPKPKTNINPAIKKRTEPIRQTAPIQANTRKAKSKVEPMVNKKPDLKYVELRPKPVKKQKLVEAKKPSPETLANKNRGQSRDNFRGLHASKVEKPGKIDPFDSYVEASKKLD